MKKIALLFLICGCSEDIAIAELDPVVMRRPPGVSDALGMVGLDAQDALPEKSDMSIQLDVVVEPACEGVVVKATHWCLLWDSDSPNAQFDNCVDGKLQGYYSGLPCPFDVAIAHGSNWSGPCNGCIDDTIITNQGLSTSAAWRNTDRCRYSCGVDGKTVLSVPR